MRKISAGPGETGRRLDVVVAELYPQLTRSSLEPLFDGGFVMVDDRPAKASHKLREKERITVDETYLQRKPPKIDLPVLYEDEDVIVLNKPPGVLTHSKGALNFEATVASFIEPKINDKTLRGNRAGIVHRLDRATSGVVIAAKTARAQNYLQKQFSQRKVKKTYLAIVEGVPDPGQAVIDAPIARNPKKPQTFAVTGGGKPSQTEYKVLSEGSVAKIKASEVEIKPLTGRTHQIRVHVAYIGHPVIGDRIYGRGQGEMMLHASELEITLPGGKRRIFKSAIPTRFSEYQKNAG